MSTTTACIVFSSGLVQTGDCLQPENVIPGPLNKVAANAAKSNLFPPKFMTQTDVDRQYPGDLQLSNHVACSPSSSTPPTTLTRISRNRPSHAESDESQYLHYLGGFLGTRVFI